MSPKDPVTPSPCHLEPPASLLASETGIRAARAGYSLRLVDAGTRLTGRLPAPSHTDLGSSHASALGRSGLGTHPLPLCPPSFSSQWGVLFRCGVPVRRGAGEPPLFPWGSCSLGAIPVIFNPTAVTLFLVHRPLVTLRRGVISLQKDAYVRVHTQICT